MKSVEPALLQIVLWKQEAGQPVTPAEGLAVANSLVSETSIETEIVSWQESRGKQGTGLLSTKYWLQLMKRHKTILQLGKGYKVASDRTEWINYTKIDQMYDLEYEQMTKS